MATESAAKMKVRKKYHQQSQPIRGQHPVNVQDRDGETWYRKFPESIDGHRKRRQDESEKEIPSTVPTNSGATPCISIWEQPFWHIQMAFMGNFWGLILKDALVWAVLAALFGIWLPDFANMLGFSKYVDFMKTTMGMPWYGRALLPLVGILYRHLTDSNGWELPANAWIVHPDIPRGSKKVDLFADVNRLASQLRQPRLFLFNDGDEETQEMYVLKEEKTVLTFKYEGPRSSHYTACYDLPEHFVVHGNFQGKGDERVFKAHFYIHGPPKDLNDFIGVIPISHAPKSAVELVFKPVKTYRSLLGGVLWWLLLRLWQRVRGAPEIEHMGNIPAWWKPVMRGYVRVAKSKKPKKD